MPRKDYPKRKHCALVILLLYNINGPDPETRICLLVLDGFLVALSPLLLEDDLHLPLGVLHDGRLDSDLLWRDDRAATHGEFARTDFVNLRERQDVPDLYVFESRHGEEVAGCEQVSSSGNRGDDILRGLRADEGERVWCRGWCLRDLRV